MASSSSACQCIFTLVVLVIAASPLQQAHARESRFFSKVSRTEPETLNTKPDTQALSPSASPSLFTKTTTEKGYGLFGKEETYEYPPTTTNPTKSESAKFNKEGNSNGYRYGAGEKQGMSDTRFFENGKYFYDVPKEVMNNGRLTENNEGHESFYGSESGSQYKGERYETGEKQGKVYGTGEKQGMSDTRFMENGKYFYDIGAEKKKNNNGYSNSNNVEFYNTNKYENEEGDEEEEEDKYGNELYGTEEEQGSVKYNEAPNGVEFYNNGKTNEYSEKVRYQGGSYGGNKYYKENEKYNGYKFKSTPNKFPKYEFDSVEEYDKYEEGRSHQKEYAP